MTGLLGPDGLPLDRGVRVEVKDSAVTYTRGQEESYTADPRTLLMAMARRQRDGASHKAIIDEFDLTGDARSPFVLERALALGRAMLDEAIAAGEEPAETLNPIIVSDEDD